MIGARYGMSPFTVWTTFSVRQLVIIYNIICRSKWHDSSFEAAVHGAEMGKEPAWYFGYTRSLDKDLAELQAYIARRKAKK